MQNKQFMITKNKRLTGIVLTAALLLSVPFVAMQFTDEVKWSPIDFIVMGILLLSAGLMCGFILRKIKTTRYRIVLIGAVLIVFLLIWAELAVGIFGTPFAGS
jgi:hypothetical protein